MRELLTTVNHVCREFHEYVMNPSNWSVVWFTKFTHLCYTPFMDETYAQAEQRHHITAALHTYWNRVQHFYSSLRFQMNDEPIVLPCLQGIGLIEPSVLLEGFRFYPERLLWLEIDVYFGHITEPDISIETWNDFLKTLCCLRHLAITGPANYMSSARCIAAQLHTLNLIPDIREIRHDDDDGYNDFKLLGSCEYDKLQYFRCYYWDRIDNYDTLVLRMPNLQLVHVNIDEDEIVSLLQMLATFPTVCPTLHTYMIDRTGTPISAPLKDSIRLLCATRASTTQYVFVDLGYQEIIDPVWLASLCPPLCAFIFCGDHPVISLPPRFKLLPYPAHGFTMTQRIIVDSLNQPFLRIEVAGMPEIVFDFQ